MRMYLNCLWFVYVWSNSWITLHETNIAPESGWLEVGILVSFKRMAYVSGRVVQKHIPNFGPLSSREQRTKRFGEFFKGIWPPTWTQRGGFEVERILEILNFASSMIFRFHEIFLFIRLHGTFSRSEVCFCCCSWVPCKDDAAKLDHLLQRQQGFLCKRWDLSQNGRGIHARQRLLLCIFSLWGRLANVVERIWHWLHL